MYKRKDSVLFQIINHFVLITFVCTCVIIAPSSASSQTPITPATALPYMPLPAQLISISEPGNLPFLRGIQFNEKNLFKFNFIVDEGSSRLDSESFKTEANRLIKYFLASLTIPEEDLWVNLSPFEKDRVVPDALGQTEMGKDLLGEDYVLKQLVASLTYPESPLGKQFWEKVYQRALHLFGTTNIPISTYSKIWIVPDKAVVYEDTDKAFIGETHLSVMLEEDYMALKRNLDNKTIDTSKIKEENVKEVNNFTASLMKEVVLPIIEEEVNNGKNFAYLRQIYHSLILATWFKKKLKESILEKVYLNKKKIKGVNVNDPQIKEKIYSQYVQAYKKGVFDYVKANYDPVLKRDIKRRYFSGGFSGTSIGDVVSSSPILQMPSEIQKRLTSASSSVITEVMPDTERNIHNLRNEGRIVGQSASPGIEVKDSPQSARSPGRSFRALRSLTYGMLFLSGIKILHMVMLHDPVLAAYPFFNSILAFLGITVGGIGFIRDMYAYVKSYLGKHDRKEKVPGISNIRYAFISIVFIGLGILNGILIPMTESQYFHARAVKEHILGASEEQKYVQGSFSRRVLSEREYSAVRPFVFESESADGVAYWAAPIEKTDVLEGISEEEKAHILSVFESTYTGQRTPAATGIPLEIVPQLLKDITESSGEDEQIYNKLTALKKQYGNSVSWDIRSSANSAQKYSRDHLRSITASISDFISNEQRIGLHSFPLRAYIADLKVSLIRVLISLAEEGSALTIQDKKDIVVFVRGLLHYRDAFRGDEIYRKYFKRDLVSSIETSIHSSAYNGLKYGFATMNQKELKSFADHLLEGTPAVEIVRSLDDPVFYVLSRYRTKADFETALESLRNIKDGKYQFNAKEKALIAHAEAVLLPYRSYILESSKEYDLPPDLLATIILANRSLKNYEKLYSLSGGISELESFFPWTKSYGVSKVVSLLPSSVKDPFLLPDYFTDYWAGLLGGFPTQGVTQIRASSVRRLKEVWSSYGIPEVSALSNASLNMYLLSPELNIKAMAKHIRAILNQGVDLQVQGRLSGTPDISSYRYEEPYMRRYHPLHGPDWMMTVFAGYHDFKDGSWHTQDIFSTIADTTSAHLLEIHKYVLSLYAEGFFDDTLQKIPLKEGQPLGRLDKQQGDPTLVSSDLSKIDRSSPYSVKHSGSVSEADREQSANRQESGLGNDEKAQSSSAIDIKQHSVAIAEGMNSYISELNKRIMPLKQALDSYKETRDVRYLQEAKDVGYGLSDIARGRMVQTLFSTLPEDVSGPIRRTIEHHIGNSANKIVSAIRLMQRAENAEKKREYEQAIYQSLSGLEDVIKAFGLFKEAERIQLDRNRTNIIMFYTSAGDQVDLLAWNQTGKVAISREKASSSIKMRRISSEDAKISGEAILKDIRDTWYIPFSGGTYQGRVTDKQRQAYRAVLSERKMDPLSIVTRYQQNGQRTVIVEYISSARSLNAFLGFLTVWAKEQLLPSQQAAFEKAVVVHILSPTDRASNKDQILFENVAYQTVNSELIKELSISDPYEDSFGVFYPARRWTEQSVLQNEIGRNAAVVMYLIINETLKQNRLIDMTHSSAQWYSDLTEEAKQMMDSEVKRTLAAVQSDRQKPYILTEKGQTENLFASSRSLFVQYPNDRIVSLGRTPLWFMFAGSLLVKGRNSSELSAKLLTPGYKDDKKKASSTITKRSRAETVIDQLFAALSQATLSPAGQVAVIDKLRTVGIQVKSATSVNTIIAGVVDFLLDRKNVLSEDIYDAAALAFQDIVENSTVITHETIEEAANRLIQELSKDLKNHQTYHYIVDAARPFIDFASNTAVAEMLARLQNTLLLKKDIDDNNKTMRIDMHEAVLNLIYFIVDSRPKLATNELVKTLNELMNNDTTQYYVDDRIYQSLGALVRTLAENAPALPAIDQRFVESFAGLIRNKSKNNGMLAIIEALFDLTDARPDLQDVVDKAIEKALRAQEGDILKSIDRHFDDPRIRSTLRQAMSDRAIKSMLGLISRQYREVQDEKEFDRHITVLKDEAERYYDQQEPDSEKNSGAFRSINIVQAVVYEWALFYLENKTLYSIHEDTYWAVLRKALLYAEKVSFSDNADHDFKFGENMLKSARLDEIRKAIRHELMHNLIDLEARFFGDDLDGQARHERLAYIGSFVGASDQEIKQELLTMNAEITQILQEYGIDRTIEPHAIALDWLLNVVKTAESRELMDIWKVMAKTEYTLIQNGVDIGFKESGERMLKAAGLSSSAIGRDDGRGTMDEKKKRVSSALSDKEFNQAFDASLVKDYTKGLRSNTGGLFQDKGIQEFLVYGRPLYERLMRIVKEEKGDTIRFRNALYFLLYSKSLFVYQELKELYAQMSLSQQAIARIVLQSFLFRIFESAKDTYFGRLDETSRYIRLLVEKLQGNTDRKIIIRDIAVSDGNTTLELAQQLVGKNVQVVGTDVALYVYLFEAGGDKVMVTSANQALQYEFDGSVYKDVPDYLKLRKRTIDGKVDLQRAQRITLLDPVAESYVKNNNILIFKEEDIFNPNEDIRQADIIRIANLVMHLSNEKVLAAIDAVGQKAKNGAYLIIEEWKFRGIWRKNEQEGKWQRISFGDTILDSKRVFENLEDIPISRNSPSDLTTSALTLREDGVAQEPLKGGIDLSNNTIEVQIQSGKVDFDGFMFDFDVDNFEGFTFKIIKIERTRIGDLLASSVQSLNS